MTCMTVQSAKGSSCKDEKGEKVVSEPPGPENYVLVPFAIVGDAITLPFQFVGVLVFILTPGTC